MCNAFRLVGEARDRKRSKTRRIGAGHPRALAELGPTQRPVQRAAVTPATDAVLEFRNSTYSPDWQKITAPVRGRHDEGDERSGPPFAQC